MKRRILRWRKRKIMLPLKKALKAGISVERLSVSLALGITLGLIPLYGFTTLIVGLIAVSLRLNFIAMQAAHYIVHPLQIALLVPFLRLGDAILKNTDFTFTVRQYLHFFRTDFWGALRELWLINLSAIGIWLILSLPLFILLYYGLAFSIRRYLPKQVRVRA